MISETLFHLRLQILVIVKYYFCFLCFLKNNSMPNGTVEDRFSLCFSGKAFGLWFLEPQREVWHPRVGARCYLLTNSVLKKLDLEDLFLIVIGGQNTL